MGIGKRPLSEEEFRSIIDNTSIYFNFPTSVREKTIWTLQAASGLRINEVLALNVRDVYSAGKLSDYICVDNAIRLRSSCFRLRTPIKRFGNLLQVVDLSGCRHFMFHRLALAHGHLGLYHPPQPHAGRCAR